jgi:hypothetical protein
MRSGRSNSGGGQIPEQLGSALKRKFLLPAAVGLHSESFEIQYLIVSKTINPRAS